MTDSFEFHDSTFNGPTAVGSHAAAWVGDPADQRYADLRRELSALRATVQRDVTVAQAEPSVTRQLDEAVTAAIAELDQHPPRPDSVRQRVRTIIALSASVAGLAMAADRLRQLLSGIL